MSRREVSRILVHNARIWTGRGVETWMVFDVETGYVLDVGHDEPPLTNFTEHCRRDAGGKQIFPGFHESHVHLLEYGKVLETLNLQGCSSVEELQGKLRDYCRDNPTLTWVLGSGWDQASLGRYPTRYDLDVICDDRPVVLRRVCIHIGVVNSKALQLLGITKDTPSPPGGAIDKFPEDDIHRHEPTGILRENAQNDCVARVCFTEEENIKFIRVAVDRLLRNGVTSAHTLELNTWKAYCRLADQQLLPMRIFYAAYWWDREEEHFPKYAGESRGAMLSCDRVKLFTDGALNVQTAALSLPYKGSCQCGVLIQSQESLNAQVLEATSRGWRLEVHAIGDAAAESALIAMESAKVAPEKRPILTHCQLLRKDLVERMRRAGVIASIQPQFVPTDAASLEKRIPSELLQYSYAWKTLLDNGIVCAGGSDAPVESPDPMVGMYDAIYRPVGERDPSVLKQYKPEESLTFSQAIDLYTKAGAYTAMREHTLGQLLPGYKADFVILETPRDISCHPEALLEAKVTQVWVDGKQVLESSTSE